MSKGFLILHGIENHRPPEHWQFLLAARLSEHGHHVLYPGLPEPDAPLYERWEASLHHYLGQLSGHERVVVCHSLACLLWFRAAPGLSEDERVDRLLLVSPPASDRVPESGAGFRLAAFDAESVRASVRGEIAIACSDADPYNPATAQHLYGSSLGIDSVVFEGAGHITPDRGFGHWQFAEDWCLNPRDCAAAAQASCVSDRVGARAARPVRSSM
jgi:predicted alpha/beta hydrolase family esterase